MSDSLLGRVPVHDETKRGVAGGVLLAVVYAVGFWFYYDLVTVPPESAWGIGRFVRSTLLLSDRVHVGFLLIPGFSVSVGVVGVQRWRSLERDRRADIHLLRRLLLTPVLVGATLGLSIALLLYGRLLFSGDGGEMLSFVMLLGLALAVIIVNGAVVLASLAVSASVGYLTVEAAVAVLTLATTDGT